MGSGRAAAAGYLVLQIGRCGVLIVALRGRPQGEHFVNDLVWELASGVLWVAGAIADGGARLLLWGLAVLLAYGGGRVQHWLPWRGRRVDLEHTEIAGGHLVERYAKDARIRSVVPVPSGRSVRHVSPGVRPCRESALTRIRVVLH